MQASDPTVLNSSIAILLQERFRQLQRAKEIREQREVFKLLSKTVMLNHFSNYYEPFLLSDSCRQDPKTYNDNVDKSRTCLVFVHKDDVRKEKLELWCRDIVVMNTSIGFDDEHSDVDTSLHL